MRERGSEILNKRVRERKIIITCVPGTVTDAWEKIKWHSVLAIFIFVCLTMQNESTIDIIRSKLNYAVESNKCYENKRLMQTAVGGRNLNSYMVWVSERKYPEQTQWEWEAKPCGSKEKSICSASTLEHCSNSSSRDEGRK